MSSNRGSKGAASHHLFGVALIAVSAASFGFVPFFARVAFGGGANLTTLLLTRFLFGAVVLWGYLALRRVPVKVSRFDLLWMAGMGIGGYAVMSGLYYSAVRFIPAGLAALLLYTYPGLVTVLAYVLLKEPVNRRIGLALLLALVGVVLVLGIATAGYNPVGVTMALGAAGVYSCYIVASGPVLRRVDPTVMSTYVITSAAAVYTVIAFFGPSLTLDLTPSAWWAVAGNTVFATLIAIPTFFAGVALIGSASASIVSTLEPLVTIAASAVLLGETLSLPQSVGAALVVGSSLLIATGRRPADEQAGGKTTAVRVGD